MARAEEVGRIRVETVDVGGLTSAYRRAGEGPPLLLPHGAWSDSRVEAAAEVNGEVRRFPRSVSP